MEKLNDCSCHDALDQPQDERRTTGKTSPAEQRAHMSNVLTRTAVSHSLSMQPQVKAQREAHIRAIIDQVMAHWAQSGHLMASMGVVVLGHQARVTASQAPLDEDYVEAVKDVSYVFQQLALQT
jgi:hypothetical protein